MTLSEFLASLQNAGAIQVTVLDSDNTELVKLFAAGYGQLLVSLLAREVDKVTILNQSAVSVVLQGELSA